MQAGEPVRICLFGAAGDTANLGVSALLTSVLSSIARLAPGSDVTVFDNGWGVRSAQITVDVNLFGYNLCGARLSRRLHRRESLWNMRFSSWFGGLSNPGVGAIMTSDAVLDISGGDSFGDLYGMKRFRSVALPKLISLKLGRPLLLLPQTYGPFVDPVAHRVALRIVKGASMAWARDARSFAVLRDLLGCDFDPARHRLGVDIAFALDPREPPAAVSDNLRRWLDDGRDEPTVGINVSGLVFNELRALEQYGLQLDYRRVVRTLVEDLVRKGGARVLLVPHVVGSARAESDVDACRSLMESLVNTDRERVRLVSECLDAREVKWLIAQLDWFCGTRMHSTIASLSSAVPSATIAYSGKALGVFESCGQGDQVADAREMGSAEALELVWRSFCTRKSLRSSLETQLPTVLRQAVSQMAAVIEACREAGSFQRGRGRSATP